MADTGVEIPNGSANGGLAGAMAKAPWWAVVLIHLGVPNFITLAAVGVVLGLVPSPHLMDKFRSLEKAHVEVEHAVQENTEVQREQTEVLRAIKACLKHPEWKSCE
jgi:hypothetical protein